MPAATPRAVHPWVAEQEHRVRFGIYNGPLADWPALRAHARDVERLGFDSLWIGDHTMLYPVDCWTTLAALAVHTERLRLGPLVSCIYYRSPALLARMAADVDRLSRGRLVLGLGIGDLPKEFEQLGLTEPPFAERARRWPRPSPSCAGSGARDRSRWRAPTCGPPTRAWPRARSSGPTSRC